MRSLASELGRWRCCGPAEVVTKNDVEATLCHLDGTLRPPTKLGGEVVRRLSPVGTERHRAAERRLVVSSPPMNPMPGMCRCWPTTTTTGDPVSALAASSRAASKATAAQLARLNVCSRSCCVWGTTARRSDPVSGRSVGPHDRRWRHAQSMRLRVRTAETQEGDGVAGSPARPTKPWSVLSSSPTSVGRPCSTTSNSPRRRSPSSREARPLVKSAARGSRSTRTTAEAAAALARAADQTRLTGADMLRHALGLEGSPLGVSSSAVGGLPTC